MNRTLSIPLLLLLLCVTATANANQRFEQLDSLPDKVKSRFFLPVLQQRPTGCGAIDEMISKGVTEAGVGQWVIHCDTASYVLRVLDDKRGSMTVVPCTNPEYSALCGLVVETPSEKISPGITLPEESLPEENVPEKTVPANEPLAETGLLEKNEQIPNESDSAEVSPGSAVESGSEETVSVEPVAEEAVSETPASEELVADKTNSETAPPNDAAPSSQESEDSDFFDD